MPGLKIVSPLRRNPVESNAPGAPVLKYDIPAATMINSSGLIPVSIEAEWFLDNLFGPLPLSPTYTLTHAVTTTLPPAHATTSGLPKAMDTNPIAFPDYAATAVSQEKSAIADAESLMSSPPVGIGVISKSGDVLLGNYPKYVTENPSAVTVVTSSGDQKFNAVLTTDLYGNSKVVYVPLFPQRQPRIYFLDKYKTASFLGDYGATNTVATFSLLPGEQTIITLSQTANSSETKDLTTNVLDSYSSSATQDLEDQIDSEQADGYTSAQNQGQGHVAVDASQTSEGGSINAHASFLGFGGGASGSYNNANQTSSTDTSTDNLSRTTNTNTLKKAMDKHVEQSSNARNYQATTGTTQSQTTSETIATTVTRTITNINRSRVLNFVMRQLSQEYHSVTYLDDIALLYCDGSVGSITTAKLLLLDEFIANLIKPEYRAQVKARIVNSLYNVMDYQSKPRQFIEQVPLPEYTVSPEGPTTMPVDNSRKYRRRIDLSTLPSAKVGDENLPEIDGIILDVSTRILRTDQIVCDALLGDGESLDTYNVQLQVAAYTKENLENDKTRAALNILEIIADPAAKADAYSKMFYAPPSPVEA